MTEDNQQKLMDEADVPAAPLSLADLASLEAALADLDLVGDDAKLQEAAAPPSASDQSAHDARMTLIREQKVRYLPGGSKNGFDYESLRRRLAEKARNEYAEQKGGPVRGYRQGLDAPTAQQRKDERNAQARAAYAEKNGTVRRHTKLADMTAEERASHKRDLAAARKRNQRERESAATETNLEARRIF